MTAYKLYKQHLHHAYK